MPSFAIRLRQLDDDLLEGVVEIFADRIKVGYVAVHRMGQADDKGCDVVGFLTPAKQGGPQYLYQCKRMTYRSAPGVSEVQTIRTMFRQYEMRGCYAVAVWKSPAAGSGETALAGMA